jgi:hypothetical protein
MIIATEHTIERRVTEDDIVKFEFAEMRLFIKFRVIVVGQGCKIHGGWLP